jgi:hypothetical protein
MYINDMSEAEKFALFLEAEPIDHANEVNEANLLLFGPLFEILNC